MECRLVLVTVLSVSDVEDRRRIMWNYLSEKVVHERVSSLGRTVPYFNVAAVVAVYESSRELTTHLG